MTEHLDIRGGLRAAREAWGGTLVEAEAGLKLLALSTGVDIHCSNEQLRRMENGTLPEEKWSAEVVALLAELYKVNVDELGTLVVDKARAKRDLLNRAFAWQHVSAGVAA
jgi:hypothetical protein